MSMDPTMMAQMLASQLGGQQQQGPVASQQQPLGAAADLTRKIMLMQALQRPPQQQAPGMPLQPNPMGGVNAQPQAMQAQQMPGAINA